MYRTSWKATKFVSLLFSAVQISEHPVTNLNRNLRNMYYQLSTRATDDSQEHAILICMMRANTRFNGARMHIISAMEIRNKIVVTIAISGL